MASRCMQPEICRETSARVESWCRGCLRDDREALKAKHVEACAALETALRRLHQVDFVTAIWCAQGSSAWARVIDNASERNERKGDDGVE